MRILILGAGGIIGQHMRLNKPPDIEALYTRRQSDPLHHGIDFDAPSWQTDLDELLRFFDPDAIINLAGENRPDVVERNPDRYMQVNVSVPARLSRWAQWNERHYIHVSSQAVFGGRMDPMTEDNSPPYRADSFRIPVNAYGRQKLMAEQEVMAAGNRWTIVRPTFVLGVRPLPLVGRQNPVEQMLEPEPDVVVVEGEAPAVQRHVNDRYFSVSFAWDVAQLLWMVAEGEPQLKAIHAGIPYGVTRYDLAKFLRPSSEPIRHEELEGFAPRPMDTTYAGEGGNWQQIEDGLRECQWAYMARQCMNAEQRAREIAIFRGTNEACELARLHLGFGRLHQEVAADFRAANPQTDEELLEWYRTTESYIYELSAYHLDPGFNYTGMCQGIAEALKAKGCKRVLCLGDGIGDLTLTLRRAGLDAYYHDLGDSNTARFAMMRLWMYTGSASPFEMSFDWQPTMGIECYDAIVSLDYLEHVKGVPAWTEAIYNALTPGGWFVSQNAFNIGSGKDGSIPMHLEENDIYEKEWDALCASLGFRQAASNWYFKP